MDEGRLARAGYTIEEIATTEGNTTVSVPLRTHVSVRVIGAAGGNRKVAYLLGSEEILGISQKHLLHTRVEDDGGHWALVAGVCPAPATVRVCKVDLDAVNRLGLVLLLRLEDELLENGIVARHDAGSGRVRFLTGMERKPNGDNDLT
jgi:hypothetical protein